jgi:hypothetical protein
LVGTNNTAIHTKAPIHEALLLLMLAQLMIEEVTSSLGVLRLSSGCVSVVLAKIHFAVYEHIMATVLTVRYSTITHTYVTYGKYRVLEYK